MSDNIKVMATTDYVDAAVAEVADKVDNSNSDNVNQEISEKIENLANTKVDKEEGKGLSSNNYTDIEKDKLSSLPTNEELQGKLDEKMNTTDVQNYVDAKVAGIVDSAPETLDTLKELSEALGNDENFATTVATELGKKVDKEVYDTDIEEIRTTHQEDFEQIQGEWNYLSEQIGIMETDKVSIETYENDMAEVDTKIASTVNMVTSSYTGNGNSSRTLTFSQTPKMVIIVPSSGIESSFVAIYGQSSSTMPIQMSTGSVYMAPISLTWGTNSLTLNGGSGSCYLNQSGTSYTYMMFY